MVLWGSDVIDKSVRRGLKLFHALALKYERSGAIKNAQEL